MRTLIEKWNTVHRRIKRAWVPIMAVSCIAVSNLANGAIVSYSIDNFDNVSKLSHNGTLVFAENVGRAITPNITAGGITFVGGGSDFFFLDSTDLFSTFLYDDAATITGLSVDDANDLLDNAQFASGVGNSLLRLDGLRVGQHYEFQMLVVNHFSGLGIGAQTASYGYATPSGDTTEIYPLLNRRESIDGVALVTGRFKADEVNQDVHIAFLTNSNAIVSAFQLRAVPEPATGLIGLGVLGVLGVRSRLRRKQLRA